MTTLAMHSSPSAGKDCGECEACLDKVKFGGRNIKKRACERRPPFNAPVKSVKRKRGPRKKKNVVDQAGGLQQILNMQQASIL